MQNVRSLAAPEGYYAVPSDGDGCHDCDLHNHELCGSPSVLHPDRVSCLASERAEAQYVIFKKITEDE